MPRPNRWAHLTRGARLASDRSADRADDAGAARTESPCD